MFSRLGEINEVQSSIPSCINRVSTLHVKMDASLQVKRCTLVLTGYGANASSKERTEEEEQVSSNHVTVQEADDLDYGIKLAKAQETLEDGVEPR